MNFVILFELGKTMMVPGAASVLASLVDAAKRGERITVVGHTDTMGPHRVNDPLARARAQRVVDALLDAGIGSDKISVTLEPMIDHEIGPTAITGDVVLGSLQEQSRRSDAAVEIDASQEAPR